MSTLWWVRHGPTHAPGYVGWSDVEADLSDSAALARLSRALPAAAAVVSSDLKRAIATADAIAGARRRLPHMAALREMNFGAWEGLSHAQVEARDARLARAFVERPGDIAPPGGESWNALAARVSAAADALARRHAGGDIVVVAHLAVILTQLRRALDCPAAEVLGQPIDNLSLTCLERADGRWRMRLVNVRP